jgi:hypothetical protein
MPPLFTDMDYDPEGESELMIFHSPHICMSHPKFVEQFKNRYRINDKVLMENKHLDFEIDNDLDS